MSNFLFMQIMGSSISIASRAGTIIRDILVKGELGIVEKAKGDLQTEADRSAQQCIIASLSKLYPNVKIIGEEGQSDLSSIPSDWLVADGDRDFVQNNRCPDALKGVTEKDLVIWVDPLDGTSEYTQGFLEHVTVLIGVSVNDKAVGGVIHQPYYKDEKNGSSIGRTIWGVKGIGVGGFTPADPPANSFIVTTTRSHSNDLVQSALNALKPTEIIRVGGAGFKVLQLLEGKAHAYVFASAGCKKWDTCAPEAVLEANGGVLTDMSGEHYTYGAAVSHPNRSGVLATAKSVNHKDVVTNIPSEVKQQLKK